MVDCGGIDATGPFDVSYSSHLIRSFRLGYPAKSPNNKIDSRLTREFIGYWTF